MDSAARDCGEGSNSSLDEELAARARKSQEQAAQEREWKIHERRRVKIGLVNLLRAQGHEPGKVVFPAFLPHAWILAKASCVHCGASAALQILKDKGDELFGDGLNRRCPGSVPGT